MFSDCGYIIFLLLLVPYIESGKFIRVFMYKNRVSKKQNRVD